MAEGGMMADKKWSEMTREEKDALIERDRLARIYQQRVKVKEAALDALQSYLKESKRKRPAPTMMYQYLGFSEHRFMKLVESVTLAQEVEDAAQHDWLHSDKQISGCSGCEVRNAS